MRTRIRSTCSATPRVPRYQEEKWTTGTSCGRNKHTVHFSAQMPRHLLQAIIRWCKRGEVLGHGMVLREGGIRAAKHARSQLSQVLTAMWMCVLESRCEINGFLDVVILRPLP